tara:strand:+ start:1226 stop:1345 length:120 start_codon:yes stop_codon:yes gene_type:complete
MKDIDKDKLIEQLFARIETLESILCVSYTARGNTIELRH